MKLNKKAILLVLLIVAVLLVAAGCAATQNPYRANDTEGYNVSIKFDANGGFFTTNTAVIVDSYNLSDLPKDSNGDAQIALLSPDDSRRGKEAFTAVKNGYFLAGWYTQRDGEGENVTYANKWDFENSTYTVKADGNYSASEPVLTLYAAWVPLLEIEIYDLNSGAMINTTTFSPLETDLEHIQLPSWDEKTGSVLMGKFPKHDGYTWGDVYLDAEGTQKVESAEIAHPGKVNLDNATVENQKMKLYVDYMEGEWFHITSAKQLASNASVSGNYILDADLDFTDQIWPTALMHGNFTGTIVGNGHIISNVAITQTNNSKVNTGLFGQLTEKASISNVSFENTTLTIEGGTRVTGASFGLLAGTASNNAQLENVAISGKVQIAADAYFGTDDYVIGLLCGTGKPAIDAAGITCEIVGENTQGITLTVENGKVVLTAAE
ncbi:MAG: hypothetical protein IJZ15_06265 [Oscillospiraceae bacterium]|nr:hypothetical protein [Oscillospiraceae bacterium]